MKNDEKVFPNTVFVVNKPMSYPLHELSHLAVEPSLELAVPDNNKETEVAVYVLVGINKYKKTVTKTAVVEQVS